MAGLKITHEIIENNIYLIERRRKSEPVKFFFGRPTSDLFVFIKCKETKVSATKLHGLNLQSK